MTEKELEEYKRINNIETVDVKGNEKIKSVYNNYANYIMVALMIVVQIGVSVLSAVDGDISNAFPKTAREWIVWIALRVINAVIAFMIFNSFVKEGEKRGKLSEQYKTANKKFMDLFCSNLSKEVKTQSPAQYLAKVRGIKSLSLVCSAVLTGVAVSLSSIMTDWTSLMGTIISIIMMLVWGYLKMLEVEEYFINEYPIYVAVEETKYNAQIKESKDNLNNLYKETNSMPQIVNNEAKEV